MDADSFCFRHVQYPSIWTAFRSIIQMTMPSIVVAMKRKKKRLTFSPMAELMTLLMRNDAMKTNRKPWVFIVMLPPRFHRRIVVVVRRVGKRF